jgi:hypothetical protein
MNSTSQKSSQEPFITCRKAVAEETGRTESEARELYGPTTPFAKMEDLQELHLDGLAQRVESELGIPNLPRPKMTDRLGDWVNLIEQVLSDRLG